MTDNTGYDLQQLMYRNQHGGIVWEKVRITAERTSRERIRSTQDKRLFEAMDGQQEGAFYQIASAHNIITAGLGSKAANYGAVRGQGGDEEYAATLLAKYTAWHVACKKQHFSPIMALDIIVEGLSPSKVDEIRKMMNGTTKKNLLNCLNVWGEV